MARTHTVRGGDTLSRIAVKSYGDPQRWTDIVKANPQLSGRKTAADGSPLIFPGDVLSIPKGDDGAAAAPGQTVVMDGGEKQDLSLVIGGKKFTGFTGYTLQRNVDGVDAFSFSATWNAEKGDLRKAFSPFSYPECAVFYDGEMIFKGVLLTPAPSVSPGASTINVQGYPLCGVLIDSCLPPALFPAEYSGLDLGQIARTVCEPFGVKVAVKGDAGGTFDKVSADVDDKAWDFLKKLADQRGMLLSNTADGSLLIYRPELSEASAHFIQGEYPFISCAPQFDGQKMFSHITGFTKTGSEDNGTKFTYENKALTKKGVLRCYAKSVDDAVAGTIEESTMAMAGKMFGECVRYTLTVSGHRDKNGMLYRENMAVSVKAPGAEIYRETKLLADSVTLKRSDSEGETTEFALVLPGARTGELPEAFPWEE